MDNNPKGSVWASGRVVCGGGNLEVGAEAQAATTQTLRLFLVELVAKVGGLAEPGQGLTIQLKVDGPPETVASLD